MRERWRTPVPGLFIFAAVALTQVAAVGHAGGPVEGMRSAAQWTRMQSGTSTGLFGV